MFSNFRNGIVVNGKVRYFILWYDSWTNDTDKNFASV